MTSRILPVADWPRLAATELADVWPALDPLTAQVLVVEDDAGAIIGCWAGFPLWHAEGVFVSPAHRGRGAVARLLLTGMKDTARTAGFRSIVTASLDPRVDRLVAHLGATVLPGTHYVFPVERG